MSDIAGDTSTGVNLAIGGTLSSTIEFLGDHDWVRVSLVAGESYRFSLSGAGSGAGTLGDSFLRLRNAAGTELLSDDDSGPGLDSLLTFTASQTGTYYLDAGSFNDRYTGTYALSAAAGPVVPPTPVYTMDQISDFLTDGFWDGGAHRFGVNTISYNVTALTAEGQVLARTAFSTWSQFANLTFVETTGTAMIRLDDSDTNSAYASAVYSGGITSSAFINIGTGWLSSYGTELRSYSFQTYLHEIGHALGLGHGGPYNGSATYGVDNIYRNDSWQATVMSYFDQDENTFVDATRAYVVTPQLADILAIQRLYGAANVRADNTTYGFNSNAGTLFDANTFGSDSGAPINVSYTIADSGGYDTLDYSGYVRDQFINLNAETWSSIGGEVGNVAIARGTLIENAIGGGGQDTIVGNAAGNVLYGGQGNDYLFGLLGRDTLDGGDGIDQARVGGLKGAGHDIIRIGGTVYTLDRADQSWDANVGMESFAHLSGAGPLSISAIAEFSAAAYAASANDLAFAFRTDGNAALSHYLYYGFFEGRETDFSGAQYLANYADLRGAFGNDAARATLHFLTNGVDERRMGEDPLDYIASNADLIMAFRGQSAAGLAASGLGHYGTAGFGEGRREGIDFDATQYLANFADLRAAFGGDTDAATVHFINAGYLEHRLELNPYDYVASFADLRAAFRGAGPDGIRDAALGHYTGSGFAEGRGAGVTFDAGRYLANYTDLRDAFVRTDGTYDETGAALHYILYGSVEGRTDAIL